MKTATYILLLITLLVSASCESDDEPLVENKDLIFINTFPFRVSPYSYESENEQYHVSGDLVYETRIPDTLNSTPLFKWDSVNIKSIETARVKSYTVGLFSSPIRSSSIRILNPEDLIWQWHSGLDSGDYGEVHYNDGLPVENGAYLPGESPEALTAGHYYWAIWAWDPSGTQLWFSSRQMEFIVE